MRIPDLSSIGDREKLKPKAGDEPHWHRLRQGVYVVYRPFKKIAGRSCFARFYDADTHLNRRKTLGGSVCAAGAIAWNKLLPC